MKKPKSVLEYPIVVRQHMNYMTFSMPDLGLFETLELPKNNKLSKEYLINAATRMSRLWLKATEHINKKKWVPEASDIKSSVRKSTKRDLTPLQFAKHAGVSEQTIRRDIERGIIKAKRTGGGHRKIPESQLHLYLQFLKSGNKRSKEDRKVMQKLLDQILDY
jgi:excisionase family DNA binding protein